MTASIKTQALSVEAIGAALGDGWRVFNATRWVSVCYAMMFTIGGIVISGYLLARALAPFIIAAAGAFMLVGPVFLAGFFGIAKAYETGNTTDVGAIATGFRAADPSVWALALVCALLFMIFITDAAILYSYMIGGTPVWLTGLPLAHPGVLDFLIWALVSGVVVALLLFAVSAFSVPLLCERRANLVNAVAISVRMVLGNPFVLMLWATLLGCVIIASVLVFPLLPITLPWMAYASRSVYRHALPAQ